MVPRCGVHAYGLGALAFPCIHCMHRTLVVLSVYKAPLRLDPLCKMGLACIVTGLFCTAQGLQVHYVGHVPPELVVCLIPFFFFVSHLHCPAFILDCFVRVPLGTN
jgi:hypothetical protein